MRLLGHLLATDLRRVRWLLAIWLIVVASAALVDAVRPIVAADPQARELVSILRDLVWPAELLLMFVLVAVVMQAHPAVGSTAFWMTRPIPPRTIVAGQVLLLGLTLIAVPVLGRAVLMAAYEVSPHRIAMVAAEQALFQTFWVTLLGAAAALTPNLARFALLCSAALVSVVVLVLILTAVATLSTGASPWMAGGAPDEDPTAAIVVTVLTIVAGLTLVMVQYGTRSRVRSLAAGAGVLLVAVVVASAWPWPLLAPRLEVPAWAVGEPALRLMAGAEPLQLVEAPAWLERRSPWRLVQAPLRISRPERGWSTEAGVLDATLSLNGANDLASGITGFPEPVPIEGLEGHPVPHVVRDLLGVERLIPPDQPEPSRSTLFFLPEFAVPARLPASGTYRGRFLVRLIRHEVEATLALKAGAVHRAPAYRLVIDDIERRPHRVSIFASESTATSDFDRQPPSQIAFYLRNRRSGEAVEGRPFDPYEVLSLSRFLPFTVESDRRTGFRTRALVITFITASRRQQEATWPFPDEWLDGAELVVLRTTREGTVHRLVEIPDVQLHSAELLRTPDP